MAGGKETPRQKMINLMYLVFIAMLALNMSKEVLSAFGSINEKLNEANISYVKKNNKSLNRLLKKAATNNEFKVASEIADSVHKLSNTYNSYLASQKKLLLSNPIFVNDSTNKKTEYEVMDQSDFLDKLYYKGGKLTQEGQLFLTNMDTYKNGMVMLLKDVDSVMVSQINSYFDSSDIKGGDGITKDYISYNYVGFPLVSSLTKMTQIQNSINTIENEVLSLLVNDALEDGIGIEKNYEAVMIAPRSSYYTGSTFDGIISLGRVDNSTKPAKVELLLDGKEIKDTEYEFNEGRIALKVKANKVGDHKITGKLVYLQDGNEVEVLVDKKFTTINKPNIATVSSDKMNVLYRGVLNPLTISFSGVNDEDIKVTAPGLLKLGKGKYGINVTGVKSGTVTVNVSGTLPDGEIVKDKALFRIKQVPSPQATLRGEIASGGEFRLLRSSLQRSTVGASMGKDFDFDLPLKVTGFSVSVRGYPTIAVKGNRFNERAIGAISKAGRGATVRIFDIQAKIISNSKYRMPKVEQIYISLID